MTLAEAIATQPAWVGLWLNVLLLGAFVAPLSLLIWKTSRKAGFITFISSAAGAFAVEMMFAAMGYVKLLGLPHVILWTPVVIFLLAQQKRGDMPVWPRQIMRAIIAIICVSLAFDYADVIRYFLGERAPLV